MQRRLQLINFNVPIATRQRFDALCKLTGRTRTAALITLMEDFIVSAAARITERNAEIEMVEQAIRNSRRIFGDTAFAGDSASHLESAGHWRSREEYTALDTDDQECA
jgi:predicted DNA-binding protein